MEWGLQQHPVETLTIWAAPAVLAAASCWSAAVLVGAPVAAIAAGGLAYSIGMAVMRGSGTDGASLTVAAFEPPPFDCEAGELLLDDPLVSVESDARVSQLFSLNDRRPGALVARIADYLVERPSHPFDQGAPHEAGPASDASAALHAALANIRASLR